MTTYFGTFDKKTNACVDVYSSDENCRGGPDTCGGCGACYQLQFPGNDKYEWRDLTKEEYDKIVLSWR